MPDAWNTVPLTASLQPNTAYWLAYNTNGIGNTANAVRLNPGTPGQMAWRTQGFGAWPASFGVVEGGSGSQASMFVTYNTAVVTPRLTFLQPAEGAVLTGTSVNVGYSVTGDATGLPSAISSTAARRALTQRRSTAGSHWLTSPPVRTRCQDF